MMIKPSSKSRVRYSLVTLLTLVGLAAFVASTIVVPRHKEVRAKTVFGEQGSFGESWLTFHPPSRVDSLLRFQGFAKSVMLHGGDSDLSRQLNALESFPWIEEISAATIDEFAPVGSNEALKTITRIEFSFCSGSFIKYLLMRTPKIKNAEFWECESLSDEELKLVGANCPLLEVLVLDGTAVTGSFLEAVPDRSPLRSLVLLHSRLDARGISEISKQSSLRQLSIMRGGLDVDLEVLTRLQGLKGVEFIDFELEEDAKQHLESKFSAVVDWN